MSIQTSGMQEKEIEYPSEIIFKSIFRNGPLIKESITMILNEYNIKAEVTSNASSGGKFISYTIKGMFSSEEELQKTCSRISELEGYYTMF